jgi:hypothetical protein
MARNSTTAAPYAIRQDLWDTVQSYLPKALIRAAVICLALLGSVRCGDDPDRPPEVDLLAALPRAERRAGGNVDEAIRMDVVGIHGDARTALVMRAPARVTWPVRLPLHARFVSAVTLVPGTTGLPSGVTVRMGLADDRSYHDLGKVEVTGAWVPITVDLREFSEWKFSVFYQPLRRTWRLVLNADATPGGAVAWDVPRLTRS